MVTNMPIAFRQFCLCAILAVSQTAAPQNISGSRTASICAGRPIPQLVDVTPQTGIRFVHNADPSGKYILESMSGGVLLIDYDRDGWPDIFFTNAPTVEMALKGVKVHGSLYHNNHDGTFTDVTAKMGMSQSCFGMGGAVGDYNNDGWPDLYLTCFGGNILYRNEHGARFTDVTEQAGVRDGVWSTGAAFGDYNGDGKLDLYVSGYVDFHLDDLPKFGGAATCKYRGLDVQCGPRGLKGAPDILYYNNGNGTFTDVTRAAGVTDADRSYGLSVQWVDFNNTGRPDILVANDSGPNYLYKNDGHGKFTEIGMESGVAYDQQGSEQANMGIAVGDYLHNGLPSIYTTEFSDQYKPLRLNKGEWNFKDVTFEAGIMPASVPSLSWGTAFADLDNDGWLDLIVVNGHVYPQVDTLSSGAKYREPASVYMNQKDGTFCDASTLSGKAIQQPRAGRGLAMGDLFNDGQIDFVINDLDGAPLVLRNRGLAANHWVSFELAGTSSNRLAIGARVRIVSNGVTQTSWVLSGGSYLSQNDLRVHFGVGSATSIQSVEIKWPSGRVNSLRNLSVDHFYSVLEGVGLVAREQIAP